MCNKFIENIAQKIGQEACLCDCASIKNACRFGAADFQITNKSLRKIFTQGEFYGVYGYDYATMFSNFTYCKEFVDMALCYLHEGDLENFMTLITHLGEYNSYEGGVGIRKIDVAILHYAKDRIQKHLHCVSDNLFDNYFVHVGFGDWNEPNAEPYLDDAIIWLNNFIKQYNLV